jgi:hypothetical protein
MPVVGVGLTVEVDAAAFVSEGAASAATGLPAAVAARASAAFGTAIACPSVEPADARVSVVEDFEPPEVTSMTPTVTSATTASPAANWLTRSGVWDRRGGAGTGVASTISGVSRNERGAATSGSPESSVFSSRCAASSRRQPSHPAA